MKFLAPSFKRPEIIPAPSFGERGIYAASLSNLICVRKRAEARAPLKFGRSQKSRPPQTENLKLET
jgi:hypothetical protein